jgi:hypothetical protein
MANTLQLDKTSNKQHFFLQQQIIKKIAFIFLRQLKLIF